MQKKTKSIICLDKKKLFSTSIKPKKYFNKKVSLQTKKFGLYNSSIEKKLSLGNISFQMTNKTLSDDNPLIYNYLTRRKVDKVECIYTFLEKIFYNLDSQKFGKIGVKNLEISKLSSFELKSIEQILIEIYKNPNAFYSYEEFYRLYLQVNGYE